MTISRTELDSFHQFASAKIVDDDITLDEVWHLWRTTHPTSEEYAENVAAINASINDYQNGERGRNAGEVVRELREKHDLTS